MIVLAATHPWDQLEEEMKMDLGIVSKERDYLKNLCNAMSMMLESKTCTLKVSLMTLWRWSLVNKESLPDLKWVFELVKFGRFQASARENKLTTSNIRRRTLQSSTIQAWKRYFEAHLVNQWQAR